MFWYSRNTRSSIQSILKQPLFAPDQDLVPEPPDQMEEADGCQAAAGPTAGTAAASAHDDGGSLPATAANAARPPSLSFPRPRAVFRAAFSPQSASIRVQLGGRVFGRQQPGLPFDVIRLKQKYLNS